MKLPTVLEGPLRQGKMYGTKEARAPGAQLVIQVPCVHYAAEFVVLALQAERPVSELVAHRSPEIPSAEEEEPLFHHWKLLR